MEQQAVHRKSKEPKEKQPIANGEQSEDWWAEFCKASAIHGMPYLARKDLHWIERIFWFAFIIAAAYYAINSCLDQWGRFRNKPIVYEYEYLFGLRYFPFMGITFCTQFVKVEAADELIMDTWQMNETLDAQATDYYRNFLHKLNHLNYANLITLEPYENDSSLANLSFVDIMLKQQRHILGHTNDKAEIFAPMLTEMGLCQTTTQLMRYGNPYGKIENQDVTPSRRCDYFDECKALFTPSIQNTKVLLYVHDVKEVMLPHDRRSVFYNAEPKISTTLIMRLDPISAESAVQNLPIAYRKCRYVKENYLQYYSPYHPSLCRLECRINVALDLCHCKPFFYAAGPKTPLCDVAGMLCLARKKWLEQPCNCLPLCKENLYIFIEESQQSGGADSYEGASFERTIILKMELSKMGVKRRVVFSTDQLIMSFGGAIGLFLGASFMTLYGLIYYALYFVMLKCYKRCKKVDNEKRIA
ncbi:ppk25 [Drosophila busckii]|uniref:Ppk25 n=1 Tax=Drosophila busckii TaxID=30019 RepID=A0A0M4E9G4_DROBS|nr:uncharacterized protein LOC108594610 [Drosophila busckii]ALC41546.1 ppk25 [Drosophila busckii]